MSQVQLSKAASSTISPYLNIRLSPVCRIFPIRYFTTQPFLTTPHSDTCQFLLRLFSRKRLIFQKFDLIEFFFLKHPFITGLRLTEPYSPMVLLTRRSSIKT